MDSLIETVRVGDRGSVRWCSILAGAAAVSGLWGLTPPIAAQCGQWQQVANDAGPTESLDVRLAYDAFRGRTVAIVNEPGAINELHVWEWDGAWSRVIPASPSPAYAGRGSAWIYDSVRRVCLLYAAGDNDLYAWNGAAWSRQPQVGLWPPVCESAVGGFDVSRGRAVFVLKLNNVQSWQTWEWTGSGWGRGDDVSGFSHVDAMAFDTWRHRGMLYGTDQEDPRVRRLSEYTPAALSGGIWQRVALNSPPTFATRDSNLVFDSRRGRLVHLNGVEPFRIYSFDLGTSFYDHVEDRWSGSLDLAGLPFSSVRARAGAAFDSGRDKLVLFGGYRGDINNGIGQLTFFRDTLELSRQSPVFLALPSGATVNGGGSAILAAAVAGETSLQWLRDGVPVAGATGPAILVTNAAQANAGLYVLRASNACGVTESPPVRLTVREPSNDSRFAPSSIYAVSIPGTTLGATPDGAAPCGDSDASPDVWFAYTVPYEGLLTIDTCGSNFDTVLSLLTRDLAFVLGCNDDTPVGGGTCGPLTSSLTLTATQGQQMLVRVAGFRGAAGNFILNTRLVPFNNACAAATPVFSGAYAGNTTGATVDGSASCGVSASTPDIWYRFRSDCTGLLTLDTAGSSFDTVLSVRTGCGGVEIACNDDEQGGSTFSLLSIAVQPGADYLVRVSGFNGATGAVLLNVHAPVLGQDACEGATPIGLGDHAFATRCARTGPLPLPAGCGDASGGVPFYDVWYRYTAADPGVLEVRLCNTTFNAAVAAYASCPTSPYDAFACGADEDSCGDTPLVSIDTLPGEEYLLRVGGYYGLNPGLAGGGTLGLTLVPFETGACCLLSGDCVTSSGPECAGTFSGAGTVCDPSPCPPLAGSCCTGTVCQILAPVSCDNAGGAFGGSGSACDASSQNPVLCCRVNFNGEGGLSVQDIFDFLAAYFGGEELADFNRSGAATVQDIFDFLAGYFAGC